MPPFDPFSALAAFLIRVQTLGLLLGSLALAAILVALGGAPSLNERAEPVIRPLGAGVFFVAALLAGLGALVYLRWWRISRATALLAAGWMLVLVFVWGLAGLLRTGGTLAGVALQDITLGGGFGHFLTHSRPGLLIMVVAFAGASALLWPRLSLRTLALIPPTARTIWGWRLPERFFRMVVDGFRALFAGGEPPPAMAPVVEDDLPDDLPLAGSVPAATPPSRASRKPKAEQRAAEPPLDLPHPSSLMPHPSPWPRPPRDLLVAAPSPELAAQDNAARAQVIVDALASFGVDAKVVSVSQGPTVTQFGIEPGWEIKTRNVVEKDPAGRAIIDRDGRPKTRTEEVSRTRVRVNQITNLANDLALALAAPAIRIEAPVPGRSMVGIEVPNTNPAMVTLRGVLDTPVFQKMSAR